MILKKYLINWYKVQYQFFIVFIFFIHFILVASTGLLTRETPISLEPYIFYSNNFEIQSNKNFVLDREKKEDSINANHKNILSYTYESNTGGGIVVHQNNYVLNNFCMDIIKLAFKNQNANLDIRFYFILGLIPIFISLLIPLLSRTALNIPIEIFLVWTCVFILGSLRLIFNLGYPESSVGLNVESSFLNYLKSVIGPLFLVQGHAGFWGIEPRNISIFLSAVGMIFMIYKPDRICFLFFYASLLTSFTQGILGYIFFVALLIFLKINFKYLVNVSLITIVLFISTLNFTNSFTRIILIIISFILFCYSFIIPFSLKIGKKMINRQRFKLFFLSSLLYLLSVIISNDFRLLYLIDSFILKNISDVDVNIHQAYILWGRSILQEFPGRFGNLLQIQIFCILIDFFVENLRNKNFFSKVNFKLYLIKLNYFIFVILIFYVILFIEVINLMIL